MELYTNSHPILVSERVTSSYNKMITDMTLQNTSIFRKLYDDIIYPNLGLCILIFLILVFLIWRYWTVKSNKEKFQKNHCVNIKDPIYVSENTQYNPSIQYFGGMDHPQERIARPTFNPSIPINKQQSYVKYLPDTVPVINNCSYINNVQEMPYTSPPDNLNSYQYTGPCYRAGENGVSDDMYNDFVEYNKQNLSDYDNIIDGRINLSSASL